MGVMKDTNWKILKESYSDQWGSPIYHEVDGVKYWGPHGMADTLGFDPEIVVETDEQLQQKQREALQAKEEAKSCQQNDQTRAADLLAAAQDLMTQDQQQQDYERD